MKTGENSIIINRSLLFFIIFVVMISFSFSAGILNQGQNTFQGSVNKISFTASPVIIYANYPEIVNPIVKITLQNNNNETEIVYIILKNSVNLFSKNYTLLPGQFQLVYINLNKSETNQIIIPVTVKSSNLNSTFIISLKSSLIPLFSEITFLLSILFYSMFVLTFRSHRRLMPFLILASYFIISPLFGQRYDMYFMIASPYHLIQNVNPFLASNLLPGGLKWEYPPLFLYYSYAVEFILIHLKIVLFPNNVIYSGVEWGYNSMAWRGIVGSFLPLLYLIIKIPMIISTFLIYYILNKREKLFNLTKLWLLNPAVILIGVLWGQMDVIASLLMLLSIINLEKGDSLFASISATAGAFVKIFPVFMLPIIIIKSKNRLRDVIAISLVSIFSVLPYVFIGNFKEDIMELIYSRSVPTYNNLFSANGLTWQVILMDLGVKSFPSLGLFIFLPAFVLAITIFWKKKTDVKVTLILIFSIFFLTYNFVNPQYFIIILPLFIMLKKLKLFLVYSALPAIYVFLTYSMPYFMNPFFSYNYFSSYLGQIEHVREYATSSYPVLWSFVIISTAIYLYTLIWSIRHLKSISGNNLPELMAPT